MLFSEFEFWKDQIWFYAIMTLFIVLGLLICYILFCVIKYFLRRRTRQHEVVDRENQAQSHLQKRRVQKSKPLHHQNFNIKENQKWSRNLNKSQKSFFASRKNKILKQASSMELGMIGQRSSLTNSNNDLDSTSLTQV